MPKKDGKGNKIYYGSIAHLITLFKNGLPINSKYLSLKTISINPPNHFTSTNLQHFWLLMAKKHRLMPYRWSWETLVKNLPKISHIYGPKLRKNRTGSASLSSKNSFIIWTSSINIRNVDVKDKRRGTILKNSLRNLKILLNKNLREPFNRWKI